MKEMKCESPSCRILQEHGYKPIYIGIAIIVGIVLLMWAIS